MKACFLANMYFFNKKFSLDPEVADENSSKTAAKCGCQQLPAFFWPIREEPKGQ